MKQLISTKQLRTLLGVSKGTLDKWRDNKVIPYLRVGDVIRYDLDKVKSALKNFQHDAAEVVS